MIIEAVHLPAGKSPEMIYIDNHSLTVFQMLVGGDIEAVRFKQPAVTMYVDMNGRSRKRRYNLWGSYFMERYGHSAELIVGDALLVGGPDKHGYDQDIPYEALITMFEMN